MGSGSSEPVRRHSTPLSDCSSVLTPLTRSMRRAHILVVGLTGVSTEAIKNLVLAGIGTLSILDDGAVRGEDLSAGFCWREDEVGGEVSLSYSLCCFVSRAKEC